MPYGEGKSFLRLKGVAMAKQCRERSMIEWLPSVMEARQWPGRLGERLGDASMEAVMSISDNVTAGEGISSVNWGGD